MSDTIIPTPPPNQTEPRREWQDWFSSMYRYVRSNSTATLSGMVQAIQKALNAHVGNTSNPHQVTWGQVVTSASTLATIQQNSHSLLRDIGTNTHAEIDAHLASLANPHQVTVDQVYAQGGPTFLTNRDPLRYGFLGT